jgi:hypothetical protein
MIRQNKNGLTSPMQSKTWWMKRAIRAIDAYYQELPHSVSPVIGNFMVIIATSFTCWPLIMKIRIIFAYSAGIRKTKNPTNIMDH